MADGRTNKSHRRQRPAVQLLQEIRIILNVVSSVRIREVLKRIMRRNECPAVAVAFLKERPANVLSGQLIADMLEGIGLGLGVGRIAGPKGRLDRKSSIV